MQFPIVSYIKDSTKEYEGEFSLVLFCSGCNFNCKGCYNAKTILDKDKIIGDATSLLETLVDPITSAIVLLGGEPSTHPSSVEVLKKAKNMGLKTKMFTNGYNFDTIANIIDLGLLDELSVDLKAVKDVSKLLQIEISDDEYLRRIHKVIDYATSHNIKTTIHSTMFPTIVDQRSLIVDHVKINWPSIDHRIQEFLDPTKDGVL